MLLKNNANSRRRLSRLTRAEARRSFLGLEKLEDRAMLAIDLLWGGTGTTLSLTEDATSAADNITVSQPTGTALSIQLGGGAKFGGGSNSPVLGLTYYNGVNVTADPTQADRAEIQALATVPDLIVDTKAGDDTVILQASTDDEMLETVTVSLGSDTNSLNLQQANLTTLTVTTSGGTDSVDLSSGSNATTFNLNGGATADQVTVALRDASTVGTLTASLADGNDDLTVKLANTSTIATLSADLGLADDDLIVGLDSSSQITVSLSATMSDGTDNIDLKLDGASTIAAVTANLGAGTDTLDLVTSEPGSSLASLSVTPGAGGNTISLNSSIIDGIFTINPTGGTDSVTLNSSLAGSIAVAGSTSADNVSLSLLASTANGITFNTGASNDALTLVVDAASSAGVVSFDTGADIDTVDINNTSGTFDSLTIAPGIGSNAIHVAGSTLASLAINLAGAATDTISLSGATAISNLLVAGTAAADTLNINVLGTSSANMTIDTLAGNDVVEITATSTAASTIINANLGDDTDTLSTTAGSTFNILAVTTGSGTTANDTINTVGTILTQLTVNNDGGNDQLNITAASNINNISIQGSNNADGIAIVASDSTVSTLIADTLAGSDTLSLTSISSTLGQVTLNSGDDDDTVTVGQNGGTLANLFVSGNADADTVILNGFTSVTTNLMAEAEAIDIAGNISGTAVILLNCNIAGTVRLTNPAIVITGYSLLTLSTLDGNNHDLTLNLAAFGMIRDKVIDVGDNDGNDGLVINSDDFDFYSTVSVKGNFVQTAAGESDFVTFRDDVTVTGNLTLNEHSRFQGDSGGAGPLAVNVGGSILLGDGTGDVLHIIDRAASFNTTAGAITINAATTLSLDGQLNATSASGAITLTNFGSINALDVDDADATPVNRESVSFVSSSGAIAVNGNIGSLVPVDGVVLATGTTVAIDANIFTNGQAVDIDGSGGVSQTAGKTITTTSVITTGANASGQVTIDAAAAGNISLLGSVSTLGQAINGGMAGNAATVAIQTANGSVTVTQINASGGNTAIGTPGIAADVSITAGGATGNINLGVVTAVGGTKVGEAPNPGADVLLTAAGAVIDINDTAASNIVADTTTISAGTGIARDVGINAVLEVDVTTVIAATSATGGIALNLLDPNASGVTVTSATATASGDIVLSGTGNGSLRTYTNVNANAGNVDISAANGNILLVTIASDSGVAGGNDVSVDANNGSITVNATTGAITSDDEISLLAGNDIVVDVGSNVTAGNKTTLTGDTNGGVAGATINLFGNITGATGGIIVNGGTNSDTIRIDSDGGTIASATGTVANIKSPITIDGGTGALDQIYLENFSAPAATNIALTGPNGFDGQLTGAGSYFAAGVALKYENIDKITLSTSNSNSDLIDLTEYHQTTGLDIAKTAFVIDGNNPPTAPGDELRLNFSGNAEPVVLAVTANGSASVGSGANAHGNVSWQEIENFSIAGLEQTVQLGDLYVHGTTENDNIQFVPSGGNMSVNLAGVSYGSYSSISRLLGWGRAGNDTITVSDTNNTTPVEFHGQAGNDYLAGAAGADQLRGGSGSDTLYGHGGDDLLGDLTTSPTSFFNPVDDNNESGNDTIHGGAGNDQIGAGAGTDSVYSGAGDDFVRGGAGNDSLYSEGGQDILLGEADDDILYGGSGTASLMSLLIGGTGRDIILGGDKGDILVDGNVMAASTDAALRALLVQWNNINATTASASRTAIKTALGAVSDLDIDYLYGSGVNGVIDWFLVDTLGADADRLARYTAGVDLLN